MFKSKVFQALRIDFVLGDSKKYLYNQSETKVTMVLCLTN